MLKMQESTLPNKRAKTAQHKFVALTLNTDKKKEIRSPEKLKFSEICKALIEEMNNTEKGPWRKPRRN